MTGLCVAGLATRAVVDRVEADRVVIEWCDATTSDLPAALFAPDLAEGAVVDVWFSPRSATGVPVTPASLSPASLNPKSLSPEPSAAGTGARGAGRPGGGAPDPRGPSRTESQP